MTSPTGSSPDEAAGFLQRHPDVEAIDVIMTDAHGIGRGKIIRRHELDSLYASGRGIPASMFAQDVAGDDVDGALATQNDGGGDSRCWPVAGSLGFVPATGRGMVLVTMFDATGRPHPGDPRAALIRQIDRARALGFSPMGAMELEFYLVDRERDAEGRIVPNAAWLDLDDAGRDALFDAALAQRKLERALDSDGLSSTARAVLQRIR